MGRRTTQRNHARRTSGLVSAVVIVLLLVIGLASGILDQETDAAPAPPAPATTQPSAPAPTATPGSALDLLATLPVRDGRCKVTAGTLHDPYTGTTIDFIRGQGTSERVQIDHVVALSDAWQKGAQALAPEQRTALANDPLNLLAVDGASNSRKRDGDAATWLPKNKEFRCEYVARQVAVKSRYDLWVTPAEHDAIARVLSTCPDEPVPTR